MGFVPVKIEQLNGNKLLFNSRLSSNCLVNFWVNCLSLERGNTLDFEIILVCGF
jgi:hypothetical protein